MMFLIEKSNGFVVWARAGATQRTTAADATMRSTTRAERDGVLNTINLRLDV
jgi:hypothetical protein